MKPTQEQALREYLREAIIPLIEDVLVKKIGQDMTFAAEELKRPKREWQSLTDDDFIGLTTPQIFAMKFAEAKLKEKNA